jgi:3',5'-cyclic AMP phosphodiesterase CpdA
MTNRITLFFMLIIILFSFNYCIEDSDSENDPFTFLVISDTHVRIPGYPDDITYNNQKNLDNLNNLVNMVNTDLSYSDLLIVTGDLVGCLYSDNADDYLTGQENPAETFKSIMDQLSIKYYPILGNHDYQKNYDTTNEEGIMTDNILNIESVWKKVLGIDPYYSIVHNGVRFIFLNSNRGTSNSDACVGTKSEAFCTGSFDEDQMAWFEDELKNPEPCILLFHHPLITDNSNKLWSAAMDKSFQVVSSDKFYEIAQQYKDKIVGIFTGHGHLWTHDTIFNTIQVYETGSVGDTMGSDDNIHIVTIDADDNISQVDKGNASAVYNSMLPANFNY